MLNVEGPMANEARDNIMRPSRRNVREWGVQRLRTSRDVEYVKSGKYVWVVV
jgi:hypothetical protein